MRRVELRSKGDEELARANAMVQECMEMRMMDTVPYLPGQWTLPLHERIMQRLEEGGKSLDAAESTYQQAGAKDKLSSVQQVRETLAALVVKNEKLKEWHARLEEAEREVQEAARLGMPWGEENFVRARERMEEAKSRLKEAGEDGLDESTGRQKPKSLILNKFDLRLLKVRRECERRRARVSQHLLQCSNPNPDRRKVAVESLAEVGRRPVPCRVDFFGNLEVMVEESEWNKGEGRGDEEVVRSVVNGLDDRDGQIRQAAMQTLPSVCKGEDATVMDKIAGLLSDQSVHVKMKAMKMVSSIAYHDVARAFRLLCDMLTDPDATVRGCTVKTVAQLLQESKDEDNRLYHQIISHALAYVDWKPRGERGGDEGRGSGTGHGGNPSCNSNWVTEERDVILSALELLAQVARKGDEEVTRRMLSLLEVSWERLLREHTSHARDASQPHLGLGEDWMQSRGPVSLRAQLNALDRLPAASCRARRGVTAAEVRLQAIQVLARVAMSSKEVREEAERLEREEEAGGDGAQEQQRRHAARARSFGNFVRHSLVVEGLIRRLEEYNRDIRWLAAQTLVERLCDQDDPLLLDAIVDCVEHMEPEVQRLGVELVGGGSVTACVSRGNRDLTAAMCEVIARNARARQVAADVLLANCSGQDDFAVEQLVGLLSDQDFAVREIAMSLLKRLLGKGDGKRLKMIEEGCHHESTEVRIAALHALTEFSDRDDNVTCSILQHSLNDRDEGVRCAAARSLSLLADRGSSRSIGALLSGCRDAAVSVRLASVDALSRVSLRNDAAVVDMLLEMLDDPEEMIRDKVLEVIDRVVDGDNQQLSSKLLCMVAGNQEDAAKVLGALERCSVGQSETHYANPLFFHTASFKDTSSQYTIKTWTAPQREKTAALRTGLMNHPRTAGVISQVRWEDRPASTGREGVLFHLQSNHLPDSRPSTRSSARALYTQEGQIMRSRWGEIFIDTDGGYDSLFGLILLFLNQLVPDLITTIHGMSESLSAAKTIKRLVTFLGSSSVSVVPNTSSQSSSGLARSRPGTAILRQDGSVRRSPSRFGPDYRRHLRRIADILNLPPLGVHVEGLTRAPGVEERIWRVENDLQMLSAVAREDTSQLEKEVRAVKEGIEQLRSMGEDVFQQYSEPCEDEDNAAVAAFLSRLEMSEDLGVTVLCLASLTNMSLCLSQDLNLVQQKVREVVIMGGVVFPPPLSTENELFTQRGIEFNFYFDPDSAHKVVHSGLQVTMIGLEVANSQVYTMEEILQILETDVMPEEILDASLILQTLLISFDMSATYSSVACFYLIRPECFKFEEVWVCVDCNTGRVEKAFPSDENVKIRVAVQLDRQEYLSFLRDHLKNKEL